MDKLPVYREPKVPTATRRSRKLLLLLLLFFITILLILFFHSSLSKITTIEITGTRFVDPELVREVSGVQEMDSYFLVWTDRIEDKLQELPEVRRVEAAKKFPGRLTITVEEYPDVAAELDAEGAVWVVLANGTKVPADRHPESAMNLPLLRGWESDPEMRLKLCRVLENIPPPLLADVSEIHPDPSVSYPDRIRIYTRSRFEIITTVSYLPDKLPLMDNIIYSMKQNGHTAGEITMLEGNSSVPFQQPEQ